MQNKIKKMIKVSGVFFIFLSLFFTVFYPDFASAIEIENDENLTSEIENIEPEINYPPIQISRISPDDNSGEFIQIANFSNEDIPIESLEVRLFKSTNVDKNKPDFIALLKNGIFTKNSAVLLNNSVLNDFLKVLPKTSIPMTSGAVQLLINGELMDQICWGSSVICGDILQNSAKIPGGYALENILISGEIEDKISRFIFKKITEINLESGGFIRDEDPEENEIIENEYNSCEGLKINEIGANLDNQFIEIINQTSESIDISNCRIMTNRSKTEKYFFSNQTILESQKLITIDIVDSGLTLTKTSSGIVYILDSLGQNEVDEISYTSMSNGTSYSKFDDGWKKTYRVTPSEANIFQEFANCPDGYFRNNETKRCNKITSLETKQCEIGSSINPLTGRCKKDVLASTLAPCASNQFRNPETGRCKKNSTVSKLTPCNDGWERNAETNRCRKIANTSTASYPTKNIQESATRVNWLVAGIAILILLILIILYQFREELGKIRVKILAKKYYNEMVKQIEGKK